MKRLAIPALFLVLSSAAVALAGGTPFSAAFAPAAETRQLAFIRAEVPGSASLHQATPFPGEVVVSPASATTQSDAPLSVRIEVLAYEADKAGAPSAPDDAHYEANPMLPFGPPSGPAPRPLFTTTTRFPAGSSYPILAPFHIPGLRYGKLARVRWSVIDVKGRIQAQGLLPDAFGDWRYWPRDPHATLDMRGAPIDNAASGKDDSRLPATADSPHSWPFLSHFVKAVEPDPASPPPTDFIRRTALLGIALHPATNAPLPVVPLCHSHGRYGPHDQAAFGNQPPGNTWNRRKGMDDEADEWRERQSRLMAAALIPGDTLGRNTAAYYAATAAFLVLFFVGTGVLLIRHFALRKGEARLRVWVALPAWCVVATLFALFALPLFLDRAPRADIIQWRLSAPGEPEAFVLETGRAQAFTRAPVSWRYPADGWFSALDYERYGTAILDPAAGTLTLHNGRHIPGNGEGVMAMRFAPAGAPTFSLSPDDKPSSMAALEDWASDAALPPKTPPGRALTAHGDFAAVWLFACGKWYSLGPMKDGETRTPDAAMFVSAGPDTTGTPFDNLFDKAPFALATGRIVAEAESWLANPAGQDSRAMPAGLDAAVVVGLRAAVNPHVDLAPLFATRRKPVVTTRIVEVEALP